MKCVYSQLFFRILFSGLTANQAIGRKFTCGFKILKVIDILLAAQGVMIHLQLNNGMGDTYFGWGVLTLAGGTSFGWGDTYPGQEVPTLEGRVPTLDRVPMLNGGYLPWTEKLKGWYLSLSHDSGKRYNLIGQLLVGFSRVYLLISSLLVDLASILPSSCSMFVYFWKGVKIQGR